MSYATPFHFYICIRLPAILPGHGSSNGMFGR